MAIPVWIPIALAAASMAANQQSQKKKDKAASSAQRRNMEANKREADQNEARAAATKALYEDSSGQIESKGQELGDIFKQAQRYEADVGGQANTAATANNKSTDAVINSGGSSYSDRRQQGAKRYSQQMADAMGNMRSVGQVMGAQGRQAQINQNDIRKGNMNMRGNNNILQADLMAAQDKGKGWGTAADLLSMASMVTGTAALAAPANAGAQAATAANASTGAGSLNPTAVDVGGLTEIANLSSTMSQPVMAAPAALGGNTPWWQAMLAGLKSKPTPPIGYGP